MPVRITSSIPAALTIATMVTGVNVHARTVDVQTAWCPGAEITSSVEIAPRENIVAFNISGAIRTVPAGGLLDMMAGVCHVAQSNTGGRRVAVGNCVWMDKDGDKIAVSFRRDAPAPGKGEVIAGTGKFAGVRGTNEFFPQQLTAFPGTVSLCVDLSWKLQLP